MPGPSTAIRGCPAPQRHRIDRRRDRPAFVKIATDAETARDLRREAAVLEAVNARLPAFIAPALLGWDEDGGALCIEALHGRDLAALTRASGLLDPLTAAGLGGALAILHREGRALADAFGPALSGPVGVHHPRPVDMRDLSAGAMEVIVLLQRSEPLCAHLDRLCVPPHGETLIHGDLRLENVMTGGPAEVRLVDWEFAGAGEGLWDVALAIAWCLEAWLSSIPQIPGVAPDRLTHEATLPLAGLRPGIAALWSAYRRDEGVRRVGALGRCLELVAVRLVQIAVEAARESEDLRAVSAMHLQLAENLLANPEAVCLRLLGLDPRDD